MAYSVSLYGINDLCCWIANILSDPIEIFGVSVESIHVITRYCDNIYSTYFEINGISIIIIGGKDVMTPK